MGIGTPYPDTDLANAFLREVLDSFPGIWLITDPSGEGILETSPNYYEKAHGNWNMLQPTKLECGLIVHWFVRPQFEQITGGSIN
jgi:hypothetical protein